MPVWKYVMKVTVQLAQKLGLIGNDSAWDFCARIDNSFHWLIFFQLVPRIYPKSQHNLIIG
jgi:hypothetical protein